MTWRKICHREPPSKYSETTLKLFKNLAKLIDSMSVWPIQSKKNEVPIKKCQDFVSCLRKILKIKSVFYDNKDIRAFKLYYGLDKQKPKNNFEIQCITKCSEAYVYKRIDRAKMAIGKGISKAKGEDSHRYLFRATMDCIRTTLSKSN